MQCSCGFYVNECICCYSTTSKESKWGSSKIRLEKPNLSEENSLNLVKTHLISWKPVLISWKPRYFRGILVVPVEKVGFLEKPVFLTMLTSA